MTFEALKKKIMAATTNAEAEQLLWDRVNDPEITAEEVLQAFIDTQEHRFGLMRKEHEAQKGVSA